jgi:hypothetical protein
VRTYFPLTDFDFYAYVMSGLALLIALDYAYPGSDLILKWDWTVPQGIALAAAGYVVGQVTALLSGWLLEHRLLRKMKSPSGIMLGFDEAGKLERLLRALTGTRYFERLSEPLVKSVKCNAARAYRCRPGELDRETIFQYGFAVARCSEDTCRRMDRDRRDYEFGRNMALVAFISGVALIGRYALLHDNAAISWSVLALATSGAMFVRYVRYYTSYHSQIVRAAALPQL